MVSKGVPKGMKRLRLTTHQTEGMTEIRATRRKKHLGGMAVINEPGSPDHGTIWGVEVAEKHQKKGLATAMYHHAQRQGIPIKHSEWRTDAGDAWAKKVGGTIPKRWES